MIDVARNCPRRRRAAPYTDSWNMAATYCPDSWNMTVDTGTIAMLDSGPGEEARVVRRTRRATKGCKHPSSYFCRPSSPVFRPSSPVLVRVFRARARARSESRRSTATHSREHGNDSRKQYLRLLRLGSSQEPRHSADIHESGVLHRRTASDRVINRRQFEIRSFLGPAWPGLI